MVETPRKQGGLVRNDNGGAVPPLVYKAPRWKYWCNYILPYAKTPRIFYCPANPRSARQFEAGDEEGDELVPAVYDASSNCYGMNYALGPEVNPRKPEPPRHPYTFRAVADPAHVVCFGDAKMPSPMLRGTKWCWKDDYAPVHDGRLQIVFVDGHVESMGKDNLGMMQSFDGWKKDTRRWSNWKKEENQ